MQQLCTLFELAATGTSACRRIVAGRGGTVRARWWCPAYANGGFHTPNHRWVMAPALVQANAAFPDLDVADVVNA
ncbi:MAG: hypothetical protein R2854_26260 [Caldilineaceae bacterium]